MQNLVIKSGVHSPKVEFNSNGNLSFSGRSLMENPFEFYTPIINWLKEYSNKPNQKTIFDINVEYFNTSSSKMILEMFRVLENLKLTKKSNVFIKWHYEEDDRDMLESGQDYSYFVKLPFEFIEYIS